MADENANENKDAETPETCFKSPSKIFRSKVHGRKHEKNSAFKPSTAHDNDSFHDDSYDPIRKFRGSRVNSTFEDLSNVQVWRKEKNDLNPIVKEKLMEWKAKYRRPEPVSSVEKSDEGENDSSKAVDELVKANLHVGGGKRTWPREEDIFDGNFCNSDPCTSSNSRGQGGTTGDDDDVAATEKDRSGNKLPKTLLSGDMWRCRFCLADNSTTLLCCDICQRTRPKHCQNSK